MTPECECCRAIASFQSERLAPVGHRAPHPLLGKLQRRLARQRSGLLRMCQHLLGIGADFFLNGHKGLCLSSAVIFDRSADDTAGGVANCGFGKLQIQSCLLILRTSSSLKPRQEARQTP